MSQKENGKEKKENHFLSKQNCLCNKINFWGVKKITRNNNTKKMENQRKTRAFLSCVYVILYKAKKNTTEG